MSDDVRNTDPFWPTWWLIYRRSVRPLFMVQAEAMRDAYNAHLAGGEPERWARPWSRRAPQDPEWHVLLGRLYLSGLVATEAPMLALGITSGAAADIVRSVQ